MSANKNEQLYSVLFNEWKSKKLSVQLIREELISKKYPADETEEIITLYRKKHIDARFTNGFILMGAGAFLGFLSCVCAILDFAPTWRNFFLYGLTSLSVLIAMAGCYLVFERK